MGHCRKICQAGRRLENRDIGKKPNSWEAKWREQSLTDEAELVLLGKFGKIVK